MSITPPIVRLEPAVGDRPERERRGVQAGGYAAAAVRLEVLDRSIGSISLGSIEGRVASLRPLIAGHRDQGQGRDDRRRERHAHPAADLDVPIGPRSPNPSRPPSPRPSPRTRRPTGASAGTPGGSPRPAGTRPSASAGSMPVGRNDRSPACIASIAPPSSDRREDREELHQVGDPADEPHADQGRHHRPEQGGGQVERRLRASPRRPGSAGATWGRPGRRAPAPGTSARSRSRPPRRTARPGRSRSRGPGRATPPRTPNVLVATTFERLADPMPPERRGPGTARDSASGPATAAPSIDQPRPPSGKARRPSWSKNAIQRNMPI